MANPRVVFQTSMGSFMAEIFLDKVPITASNFLDLAATGFYNGIHFHRVIPSFMAQFGCPYAKDPRSGRAGTGGPRAGSQFRNLGSGQVVTRGDDGQGSGAIPDEFTARISNERGTLSMANAGPNTGGSQFFINVANNDQLDWFDSRTESRHPVFGMIVQGMEVVDAITRVPTSQDDNPQVPIKMMNISVQQAQQAAAPAAQQAAAGGAAQTKVHMRLGDWAVCEDQQGMFYHHMPTNQAYDEAPPEFVQLYGMDAVDAIKQAPANNSMPMQAPAPAAQQAAAPVGAQPKVHMRLGDWAVCEDQQGMFYQHLPTNQAYDEAPPEFLQLYNAAQQQKQQGGGMQSQMQQQQMASQQYQQAAAYQQPYKAQQQQYQMQQQQQQPQYQSQSAAYSQLPHKYQGGGGGGGSGLSQQALLQHQQTQAQQSASAQYGVAQYQQAASAQYGAGAGAGYSSGTSSYAQYGQGGQYR